MKQPYPIIQFDRRTGRIDPPALLLMTRSFRTIGRIPKYEGWAISLAANGVSEVSFRVHKYANGTLCPVWDSLVDLKLLDVGEFGRFEISVSYTDGTETTKSVHGVSLEAELAQIYLHDFHVNDEEAADMKYTEYSKDNYDSAGNFIPTVFYDPDNVKHSLLHRVLADKAPHWSIGYVTPYIALGEDVQPEESSKFQRTYTADGESIYDFLTGTVAEESNVAFVFDTINREISCYSLCDCIDQKTGNLMEDKDGGKVTGIGEDTLVFVSKNRLANEITISSNKDNVKNCFRIEGGDDVITDMVRAVNMNGSNYIYQFADFQYQDMPEALVKAITDYNEGLSKEEDAYYGENGIYSRLCKAYEDLAYCESGMMPDVSPQKTSAEEQYGIMKNALTNMAVGVSSFGHYNNNLFDGISKNIEAMANVLIDARYKAEVMKDTASYHSDDKNNVHKWTGNIRVTRAADGTDYYPKTKEQTNAYFTVNISNDELTFTRQKIEKALHKSSMLDIDFEVANMGDEDIRAYFNQYSMNRLKSFYDGYNSCLSILMQLDADSSVRKEMYETYYDRMRILSDPPTEDNPKPVLGVMDIRQQQVDTINANIENIIKEQITFQEKWNFKDYLEKAGEGFYKVFCSYRREDTYKNDNYISDGLSTSECLAKAKELTEAASKETKKACVLQRTVSTSMNNLFALPEFEPLYEKFALYNYIRIGTEDEILKLRLIGIEFSGDSPEDISVTFSDQIESVDGKLSDLQSILQQAKSMATSYPSTALQAKQGAEANSEIADMHNHGLNAAKTMLSNNDSNEVTITQSGIVCKRMDDEGSYGGKQLRITGNIMAFTDDSWKTVRMAIGETSFKDPSDPNSTKQEYGIVADNIVGKLIAGNNMFIGNEDNSVVITGDGITIKNGLIQSANYEAGETGSMLDLSNGTFDYAGGRLTYNNGTLAVKGNVTADNLIAINEGRIANFYISKNKLYTNGATFGNEKGIYFGEDGLNIKNKFKVDKSGSITSVSGNIGGWEIGSKMLSCNDIIGGTLELNANNGSICSTSFNDREKTTLTAGYLNSTDGEYTARLSNAGLYFKKDDIDYALFCSTYWKGTEIRGVGVNSYADSKFISFGNKNNNSENSFTTPLVLNYGLDPNGDTQNILIYGSTLFTREVFLRNNLWFNNNAYLNGYGDNGIKCNGNGYISGNLDVGNNLDVLGNLYATGATESAFTSAPNLHIGNGGKIAKTSGSSKRFKTEIKPIDDNALNPVKLYDIDVVQYKFKEDYLSEEDQRYNRDVIGFIAEDIYEKYPIAADYTIDDGGTVVNDWNFRYMIPAMLKLIQDQKKEIDTMKQEIENLKTNK